MTEPPMCYMCTTIVHPICFCNKLTGLLMSSAVLVDKPLTVRR